ncbi:MAG TPA: hypothetical protein VFO19_18860 [Vicinamibacterales bacterium]|nr:hypothetical protein [Vicinamibacterales bacterium]
MDRRYRAGESIEDYCRACKIDRVHTVMAVGADGAPVRVVCGFCRSEHNFRGGPRMEAGSTVAPAAAAANDAAADPRAPRRAGDTREPFPLVSDRERTQPPVSLPNAPDLELLLRRVIREESGLTPAAPADRWRGGALVLRPGTPGVQEKSWPIETFFHKIVMLRNRLRTLEQQINAAELPEDVKVKLQSYITGCYGSLTSFNVLFADERDQFKGSGD